MPRKKSVRGIKGKARHLKKLKNKNRKIYKMRQLEEKKKKEELESVTSQTSVQKTPIFPRGTLAGRRQQDELAASPASELNDDSETEEPQFEMDSKRYRKGNKNSRKLRLSSRRKRRPDPMKIYKMRQLEEKKKKEELERILEEKRQRGGWWASPPASELNDDSEMEEPQFENLSVDPLSNSSELLQSSGDGGGSVNDVLKEICRLCGKEEDVNFDIFGENETSGNLPEKINKCLPGIDVKNDGLPTKICGRCMRFVNSWHEFFLKSMIVKNFFEKCDNGDFFSVCDLISGNPTGDDVENEAKNETTVVEIQNINNNNNKEEEESAENDSLDRMKRLDDAESEKLEFTTEEEREFLAKFRRVEMDGKFFYRCDQCLYSYACKRPNALLRLKRFRKHYERHEERILFCDICRRVFQRKHTLRKHCAVAHDMGEKAKFRCDICDKYYGTNDLLKRHAKIHSEDDGVVHICEVCGKTFKNKKSWKHHIQVERGKKDYQCSVCGLCLFTESSLKRHMIGHSEERKYPCPECGKFYKMPLSVNRHLKEVHTKGHFACHFCSATFTCEKYLKQHLKGKQHRAAD